MLKPKSEIMVELLSCFDSTSSVGIIAMIEHTAPENKREFWRTAVAAIAADAATAAVPAVVAVAANLGSCDLILLLQHFDLLWPSVYKKTQDGTRGQQADDAYEVGSNNEDAAFYGAQNKGNFRRGLP